MTRSEFANSAWWYLSAIIFAAGIALLIVRPW